MARATELYYKVAANMSVSLLLPVLSILFPFSKFHFLRTGGGVGGGSRSKDNPGRWRHLS